MIYVSIDFSRLLNYNVTAPPTTPVQKIVRLRVGRSSCQKKKIDWMLKLRHYIQEQNVYTTNLDPSWFIIFNNIAITFINNNNNIVSPKKVRHFIEYKG